MIFFLIFHTFFLQGNVLAASIPPLHPKTEISFYPRERIDPNNLTQRSEWNIVWSCFATIFACSWVAIHPNIPAPSDSSMKIFVRRLMIMGCMLIAPEMVIIWAARQWYAAREIAESYKSRGWTITHGFFVSMGGFMLYKDGVMTETLKFEKLEELETEGKINWPDISEKDIQDKSKGESFSKGFVVLQTTWFIIQCIARGVAGLNLTELELVTLAFAVLNGILYLLWWKKPLDVLRPVLVHFQHLTNPALVAVSHWQPQTDPSAFARFRAYLHEEFKNRGWFALIFVFIMRPFQIIWFPLLVMFGTIDTPMAITFYAPTCTSGNPRFIGMAIGILFGGIHCIAWSFDFPSVAEQYIWRISAVSVTALPIIIAASFKYVNYFGKYTLFPCTVLYWVSRSALLILPLLALRSLPPTSLLDFKWSAFIPHI